MCNRCLYYTELHETGAEFMPIHVGIIGMPRPNKRERLPNWALIRGIDQMSWKERKAEEEALDVTKFDPNEDYTGRQLEILADQLLRADAKAVVTETGKERGIGGENPILFEEHLYSRRRREIYNENGVPDPSLVSGIYYRTHPQGRKVNSDEQRKRNGASFYR